MSRIRILLLGAVVLFGTATVAGRDEPSLPPEVQELLVKQQRRNQARSAAAAKELEKAKAIIYTDGNSLSMAGDGLGGRGQQLRYRRYAGHAPAYLLAGGTLYWQVGTDFDQRSICFYLDRKRGTAQVAREGLDEFQDWQPDPEETPRTGAPLGLGRHRGKSPAHGSVRQTLWRSPYAARSGVDRHTVRL